MKGWNDGSVKGGKDKEWKDEVMKGCMKCWKDKIMTHEKSKDQRMKGWGWSMKGWIMKKEELSLKCAWISNDERMQKWIDELMKGTKDK